MKTDPRKRPNPERSTFLSGDEVVERVDEYLEAASESLRAARRHAPSEREAMFCKRVGESVAELRRVLETSRRHFQEHLQTQAQYTLALPDDPPPCPSHVDVTAISAWLIEIERGLVRVLDEIAKRASAPRHQELFGDLARGIENHQRTVSKLALGLRDA